MSTDKGITKLMEKQHPAAFVQAKIPLTQQPSKMMHYSDKQETTNETEVPGCAGGHYSHLPSCCSYQL